MTACNFVQVTEFLTTSKFFFYIFNHSVRQKINAQLVIKIEQIPFEQMMLEPGNTKGGSIIVSLYH